MSITRKGHILLSAGLIFFAACSSSSLPPDQRRPLTGAEVLAEQDFKRLSGLRVGLIANQTSVVDSVHLIDLLYEAPDIELVALFGPEHGLRGDAEAGAAVSDDIDDATGVPVYSLYGSTNRPDVAMLQDVDALVFDIQDVGARFYTYISTMGRAMQSAAESGIAFIVLDRPNPLGGVRIEGFVRDSAHVSGVGLYPIPVQHGMTVGELALMIKGESWLPGLEGLDLTVVRMRGWHRNMLWSDLDRKWIPTSPNIPTFETAIVYPGTCFFEGTSVSEGRGTQAPFLTIGAPWLDAQAVATELNAMGLPGVRFSIESVVPRTIPGVAMGPKFEDTSFEAVRIHVTSQTAYAPVSNGIALLSSIYHHAPANVQHDFFNDRWMGLLAGTGRLQESVASGMAPAQISLTWQQEVEAFRLRRTPYLRYE